MQLLVMAQKAWALEEIDAQCVLMVEGKEAGERVHVTENADILFCCC